MCNRIHLLRFSLTFKNSNIRSGIIPSMVGLGMLHELLCLDLHFLMPVVGWDSVVNLINEQQNTWWLAFLAAWGSEHNHVSQYTITVYKTILYCLHL